LSKNVITKATQELEARNFINKCENQRRKYGEFGANKYLLCDPTTGVPFETKPEFSLLYGHDVAAIDERRVQEFIADLSRMKYTWPNGVSKKLSPKSIRNIVGVLKQVVGEKVWREWSLSLPEIPWKEQRCFSPDEMLRIVNAATGQWRVLFATLASTGLRCGEAFGLHIEDLDLTAGRIYVRRSIWNGEEGSVKTKQGYRAVNIEPSLIEMMAAQLGERKGGRVFETRTGTPFCKSNVRRKLNQILKKLNLAPAGLHAFRHGRVSMLQAGGVPGDLVMEWVGHSNLRTTSRYTHFRDEFRKQVASDVGLFSQATVAEKLPVGPNGPNFPSVAAQTLAA
jgi:integrase